MEAYRNKMDSTIIQDKTTNVLFACSSFISIAHVTHKLFPWDSRANYLFIKTILVKNSMHNPQINEWSELLFCITDGDECIVTDCLGFCIR